MSNCGIDFLARLGITHGHLDVPRDQFLVAGDARQRYRNGSADPDKFGIGFAQFYGLWFIAGSLVQDVAAFDKVEVLPWDTCGAQPQPDETRSDDQLAFFDDPAALTVDPMALSTSCASSYEADDRLRVPTIVFNANLNHPERI